MARALGIVLHVLHTYHTHANTVHMSHQGLSGTSVGPHISLLSQSQDSIRAAGYTPNADSREPNRGVDIDIYCVFS